MASLLAGLLAAWIAFYMQRQPDKLRRIVTEKTQALEQLAYYDHLTGLANRRQLGEQLERVLREYPRYQQLHFQPILALPEKIAAIVRETGVDARWLEFEVTESCIMEDVEHVIETLRALKSQGIRVAIDDFGRGYSSFAQLKNLPVDRLKIDRSFVIDLETDPCDKKIVQGLVSMSHKLQLQVVAEGIETEEQLALLCRYGCDLGQGYLFSRPQPLAVVKGALEKRTQSA